MADAPGRSLPALIHVRPHGAAQPRPEGEPRPSGSEDFSARAVPVDTLRRELQSGALPRDTEVLYTGLGDWTPAHEIPELWVAPVARNASDANEADPSSIVDSAPSVPAGDAPAAPRKKSTSAIAIFGAIFGALALLAIGAGAVYFFYFHYTPVAIRHLPKKCVVAVRVDLLDWAFFKPFTDKLVPAIDEATKPPPPAVPTAPGAPPFKERLKANANIDVDRGDIREIAACIFQDTTPPLPGAPKDPLLGFRAVIAVGGRLRSGAIPGLFEAMRAEPFATTFRLDGTGDSAVIRIPASALGPGSPGAVIGQAEDGTLLLAPTDALLSVAREQMNQEDAMNATGLVQKGALEIATSHFVFGTAFGFATPPPPIDPAVYKALARVDRGHLSLMLGRTPKVELSLEGKTEGDGKEAENALRALLDIAQKELSSVTKDFAGEHGAVAGARITRDDSRVDLKLEFRFTDVDRGASELSDNIKDPASPLRTKTLPMFLFTIGAGPKPAPAASGSSSAPGTAPSTPPSTAPKLKPDDVDD